MAEDMTSKSLFLVGLGLILALVVPVSRAKYNTLQEPELNFDLVGFAAVNALGQNGTTGGAGGHVVTVSTAQEFLSYIRRSGPYVIQVAGTITLPGSMHDVASDKTIIGLGSDAVITGGGLNIGGPSGSSAAPDNATHNVIIRNLTFTAYPDDGINIETFAHHVWVDHNQFMPGFDGAVDIKQGADFITISWNRFNGCDKCMLLGHSDENAAQDIGRLRVTYHHNWFNGSVQRHPRVRFGEPVHVFNNYYLNIRSYGVASQMNAGVLVEGNYFENVRTPMRNDIAGTPGRIVARANVFVNSGSPISAGSVIEPSTYYNYTLDNPADVPQIAMRGAGVGKIRTDGLGQQFLWRGGH
jgi:pectate lyase